MPITPSTGLASGQQVRWRTRGGFLWFDRRNELARLLKPVSSLYGGDGLVPKPIDLYGEFDPGSGRTLAACLTHASRTVKEELAPLDQWRTGE